MKKLWLAAAVFFVLGLSANAHATQYTLETISFPGAVSTGVYGINNSGDVVGSYYDGTKLHGYVFAGNDYKTIDYPGAADTSLRNINESGKVVGWYNLDGEGFGFNETYGFLYDGASYISVAFPGPFSGFSLETSMNGINNNDTVVGGYWVGGTRGFIYKDGVVTTYDSGYFEDINDNDVIVAQDVDAFWSWLVINGVEVQFNGSEDVYEIFASGINNDGYVVGDLLDKDFSTYNFIYDGNQFNRVDLPGGLLDINDSGQIVGNVFSNGTGYGYIATPVNGRAVPEPSLFLLFGLAVAGIGAGRFFIPSQRASAAC